MFFAGLTWLDTFNPDDRIGVAVGQPQRKLNTGATPVMMEAYYSFKVNDSITMTPTLFGGTSKNTSNKEAVMTGVLLQTTFKF